jgi:hypothetical protein
MGKRGDSHCENSNTYEQSVARTLIVGVDMFGLLPPFSHGRSFLSGDRSIAMGRCFDRDGKLPVLLNAETVNYGWNSSGRCLHRVNKEDMPGGQFEILPRFLRSCRPVMTK